MKIVQKIITFFVILCMLFSTAICEEITPELAIPVMEIVALGDFHDAKAALGELFIGYCDSDMGFIEYYESNINGEIYNQIYLELSYHNGHYIYILVTYLTPDEPSLICMHYNGIEPSMETVANYFRLGIYAFEIMDDDEENYHIELCTDVK